jgi:DedD protein
LAQDDYYYEIQLTNKQLVFYFLAGATGLILSFLAGVMVGRGVDQGAGEVQAARVAEERVIAEETPKPAPPAAEDLTYAQRLENEKAEEARLERPRAGSPAGKPAVSGGAVTAPPTTAPAARPAPAAVIPAPAEERSATPARSVVTLPSKPARGGPAPGSGSFTIQVGAFKDKASADSVAARLKNKGFAAYVVSPEGEGLFNVRVGNFPARADAERIQVRLRDEEKYKPFIVKP